MTQAARRWGRWLPVLTLAAVAGLIPPADRSARAQENLVERKGPPELEDFETDADKNGIPDGWYNDRDVSVIAEGGCVGPRFLRFRCTAPGRPARLSRGFGIDGSRFEAILLGMWVRHADVQYGDRAGAEPLLLIEFIGEPYRILSRGVLGPWTHTVGGRWTRVVKRIPVPVDAKDAIMSAGLMGATGTLDIDGLTIEVVPRGGATTTNLIVNGDFELGDPAPFGWIVKDGRRVFPGNQSPAALELTRPRTFAMAPVAMPVNGFPSLDVTIAARCAGLRGADGAKASFFFVDTFGAQIMGPGGAEGEVAIRWSGSSPWGIERGRVEVPQGAVRAVLQISKLDGLGSIRIDDVEVTAAPNAQAGAWTPYHEAEETSDWLPVAASPEIAAGGALDFSFLLPKPAGRDGLTTVKNGRLNFSKGGRARFLGVSLIPPTAFMEPERADALADRLARSGINLVRLGELDTAHGPVRSLLDDSRDDTKALDPEALARLDHLIAALESRGIYVALELQGARRFRHDDGVDAAGLLPPGGGPAAIFDPTIGKLALATARALLDHVNPETGLALREDPALAWVTLAGEMSLFDQVERPESLPPPYPAALRALAAKAPGGFAGRRLWEWAEAEYCRLMADALRHDKLHAPIAGISHWRRDSEFVHGQAGPGLDLIDDRIFWLPAQDWVSPEVRSSLWFADCGLDFYADRKRRIDRPYVVGQWCTQTLGAWSLSTEAADFLHGVATARSEDWDALVRRGVFLFPVTWGAAPAGLVGGDDIFQLAEVVNGSPHVFALFPHAASLFYRSAPARPPAGRHNAKSSRTNSSGWEPSRGRLVIDTPYTQALVGWPGRNPAVTSSLEISTDNDFAVLAVSSIGPKPIAEAERLLVTAVGRMQPTGLTWVDSWRRTVADPGRPPLLHEPIRARVAWRRRGTIRAFALNEAGERSGEATVDALPGGRGAVLVIDGRSAGLHWELVAE